MGQVPGVEEFGFVRKTVGTECQGNRRGESGGVKGVTGWRGVGGVQVVMGVMG